MLQLAGQVVYLLGVIYIIARNTLFVNLSYNCFYQKNMIFGFCQFLSLVCENPSLDFEGLYLQFVPTHKQENAFNDDSIEFTFFDEILSLFRSFFFSPAKVYDSKKN